jgi:hypothetical protein
VDGRFESYVVYILILSIGFGETIQRHPDLFIIRSANAIRLRE